MENLNLTLEFAADWIIMWKKFPLRIIRRKEKEQICRHSLHNNLKNITSAQPIGLYLNLHPSFKNLGILNSC